MIRTNPDWRVWLGLALTAAWLILGVIYISGVIGWQKLPFIGADDLGSFLEGAFAPLAFLWLVIGYFLQKKELEQNTQALQAQAEEITRTAEQAVIQSEKMAASEIHARQGTFLQIASNVRFSLGSISGLLYLSSQSTVEEDGTVTPDEMSRLFSLQSAQDPDIFSRRLLEAHAQMDDPQEQLALFYGTEVRARHSNNFIYTFERLMRRAEEVDPDFMIRDALLTGSQGFIYRLAKRHQGNAPPELGDPGQTGTQVNF